MCDGITIGGNVSIQISGPSIPPDGLDISAGNLDLDTTTNANQFGVISKNGTRFIHDFNYGNNGTVTTDGGNTFVGLNTGNLTMGSTATQTHEASYNTALGQASLSSNTTGFSNTASGYASLSSNTTGFSNTASGYASLFSNTTGFNNTASGYASLYSNTTGFNNTASGEASLFSNTTGYQNTASGEASLFSNTTGVNNTASGYEAGRYISEGSGANATSTNSLYLGALTKAVADGDTNEVVLGYDTTGFGSHTVAYGNSSMTKHIFQAGNVGIGTITPSTLVHGILSSATTNAVVNAVTIGHNSTGTAAGSFGVGQLFTLASDTTADQNAGRIIAEVVVATHAARTFRLRGTAYDYTTEREGWRVEGDGSATKLSFFGANAVVKPVALTANLTDITHTAASSPDYALQDLVQNTGFGFATKDEGNTLLAVVQNTKTRVAELETKLVALGLLTAAA